MCTFTLDLLPLSTHALEAQQLPGHAGRTLGSLWGPTSEVHHDRAERPSAIVPRVRKTGGSAYVSSRLAVGEGSTHIGRECSPDARGSKLPHPLWEPLTSTHLRRPSANRERVLHSDRVPQPPRPSTFFSGTAYKLPPAMSRSKLRTARSQACSLAQRQCYYQLAVLDERLGGCIWAA